MRSRKNCARKRDQGNLHHKFPCFPAGKSAALFRFAGSSPKEPLSRRRVGWIAICAILSYTERIGSRPVRGGWIEIRGCNCSLISWQGPTPHGVGGLKCVKVDICGLPVPGPTPHGGGGGLKFDLGICVVEKSKSRPAGSGWPEIQTMPSPDHLFFSKHFSCRSGQVYLQQYHRQYIQLQHFNSEDNVDIDVL